MLRLRPYKACDAEKIVSWTGDERAFRLWCADRYDSYPITADDMNSHYEQFAFSDSFFPMTAFDGQGVCGHLIMRFTDSEKKVVRFGFIIVDDGRRGCGLGREMLGLAAAYAFDILKVSKITLGVFENNQAARRCYQAAGFCFTDSVGQEFFHVLDEDWKCLEMELLPI